MSRIRPLDLVPCFYDGNQQQNVTGGPESLADWSDAGAAPPEGRRLPCAHSLDRDPAETGAGRRRYRGSPRFLAEFRVGRAFQQQPAAQRLGVPGGIVTVAVTADGKIVRVEISDRAGPGVPELRPADCDAEGGRGLRLVSGLAAR